MAVGGAEADDEQVGIVIVALDLKVWYGDERHFLRTQVVHHVMVVWLSGDGACLAVLLQSAENVLVALLSRDGPVASLALRVAQIRRVFVFLVGRGIVGVNLRQLVYVGQLPCRRAIGYEGVGEQDDRREMLQRYLCRHESCVEAVGRACGRYYGHRALAVSAIQHLQQVGLLALGWQSGGRSATLHVHDDQWQLVDDGKVDGLALQANARAGCRRAGQRSGESRANGRRAS